MVTESRSIMQEALEQIFSVPEGATEVNPMKIDFRILKAVYICCADGNEQACLRFESSSKGLCKHKAGDTSFCYAQ